MSVTRLRPASRAELPALTSLWQLCFGDEASYISFFFQTWFTEENCLILERDGSLESMLMGLPTSICLPDGTEREGVYIYALCTDPTAQRRGNAGRLLSYAELFFRERGCDFFLLTPQEPSLFSYFQTQRFVLGFPLWECSIPGLPRKSGEKTGMQLKKATLEEYQMAREAQLNGRLFVRCSSMDLAYQKVLSESSGAGLYLMETEHGTGCVTAEYVGKAEDTLVIKELLMDASQYEEGLRLIQNALPAKRYLVRIPVYQAKWEGGKELPFSLFRPLRPGVLQQVEPYFPGQPGFAFD